MNGTSEARPIAKLQSKEYRDSFMESHVRTGLPFQLRAMRAARGWSQEDLGDRAGMGQNVVARLENPDYGKFSIATLLKLASAFDVALMVRFVRFSELFERTRNLTPEALNVPSFSDDQALRAGGSMTWPEQQVGPHVVFVTNQNGNISGFGFFETSRHAVQPKEKVAPWTTLNAKSDDDLITAGAPQ